MKQARVLIVDDDRDLAESLADFVEMHGHQVTLASNGKEAVECFREREFDIAFMDVRMPIMNGVDSFLEIRQLRPDAKVVLMTGFKEPIVDRALQNGALGVLQKPFQLSDLLAELEGATKPVVLIAEDNADVAQTLRLMLEFHGYKASVAATGQDALARVQAGGIDVLILDLRLPVMGGLQVYETLKAQGTPPPTVVVSGHLDSDNDRSLRRLHINECLSKPIRVDILLAAIERVVGEPAYNRDQREVGQPRRS